MLEVLILTLRERVDGAPVVRFILATIRREGQEGSLGAVWAGAGAASAGGAA